MWEKGKKRCFRLDELGIDSFFFHFTDIDQVQILIDAVRTPGFAQGSYLLGGGTHRGHTCWGEGHTRVIPDGGGAHKGFPEVERPKT